MRKRVRSGDCQAQVLEATHEQARQPLPNGFGLDLRRAFQQLTEHDPRLQAGKRRTNAEMDAFTEGDVALGRWAVEPELRRVVEVQSGRDWPHPRAAVDASRRAVSPRTVRCR